MLLMGFELVSPTGNLGSIHQLLNQLGNVSLDGIIKVQIRPVKPLNTLLIKE